MLEKQFRFDLESESYAKDNPYKLVLKQDSDWKHSRRRLLVVLQTVDSRDLKAEELLGDRNVYTAFKNAYYYSRKIAQSYLGEKALPEFSITVVNFNAFRHLHFKNATKRREAEAVFAERVHKMIRKLDPTHVLFSGDEAIHACYPDIKYPQYKRGWIHNLKEGDRDIKVTSTLDFSRLLENNGEYANLLGFFCRHLAYLQLGKHPHDISHIKCEPRYIKTIDQFDSLMRRFDAAEECAIDTETKNLSSLHNRIYTIQFAFDKNPLAGYILAVDHPLCHWSSDERKYIKRELRKRFAARKGPLLLTYNGHMFDLRVIRQALRIPIIWLKVWEITFGEHELDENLSLLNDNVNMMDDSKSAGGKNKKSTFGGLAPTLCSYGNDHYYTAKFGKSERGSIGAIDIEKRKDSQEYMAMDVVSLLAMKKEQIRRASFMKIENKNFKPYFIRHMLYQMSDQAHTMSHMRNDGSVVSRKELRRLLGDESPLKQESKRVEGQLKIYKEVKQANKELLAASGFKAGNLFGGTKENWMFKMSKPAHKKKLFFDVLGLEPLSKTETGEGQIDKHFIEFYKDKNKIVSLYGEQQAIAKLMSTYVKGWYKRLQVNLDEATDAALRADYFLVDTGRLGSSKPNLQQIPSRGKLAKSIKGLFWAIPGYVQIQFDYSAHEVRMWGVTAGDKGICDTFRMGQKLRQKFIATDPIPSYDIKLKKKVEEWLSYNPETGIFTWKKSPGKSSPIGKIAGSRKKSGVDIRLDGEDYRAHRLAFLMSWGWLPEEVDHKNNDPYDNRKCNLRPATRSENAQNRKAQSNNGTGYKGVFQRKSDGKFIAQIKPPGYKSKHLGVFDNAEDAHTAYTKAAKKYHKAFANNGRNTNEDDDTGDYRHPWTKAKDEVKTKGDVHILNVKRFFNQLVDKNHPLRHAIKAVVFGVLYGKGPETLGEDTKQNDLAELKEKIAALYDESLTTKDKKRMVKINAMMEELDVKLTALIEEDRSGYAQDIIDRMFNEFKAGKRWIDKMGKMAEEQFQVYSPNGRVRHLYAAMTGDRKIISQQVRRGSNAPIQGFASESGAKAARMILADYYKNLRIFKEQLGIEKSDWDLRVFLQRMVHDAAYFMVPYEMVIPFIHILQYQGTYGVARQYEKDFNINFAVEPEIEIDIGARGDHMETWDWSTSNLISNIKSTVKEAEEMGVLAGTPEEVLEMIIKPWKSKRTRSYLQEHYPLLNVKDLDEQIRKAVAEV